MGAMLAEAVMLVSVWKPIVLLLPFVPWAWVVSKVLDKHAARFFLAREAWNLGHLVVGLVAFAVALLIPLRNEGAFWAGFGAMVVILSLDVVVFALVTNRDERVPEAHRLRFSLDSFREKKAARAAEKKQGKVQLVMRGPDKSVLAPPDADTPEFEVRAAAEGLYLKAKGLRATQVDVLPMAGGAEATYQASYLVDGVRQGGETMPAAMGLRVIDVWKGAGKLDLAERRKRQVADVTVEQETSKQKVRVTVIGSQQGVRCTLLLDPEGQVRRKFEGLGLLEPQAAELKAIAAEEHGVVLVGGRPDGGRTTVMYALAKLHDAYTRNVQTVEMEQQDTLEGARQNVYEATPDGPEFSTYVRSVLRRDPDVVVVAELPDAATAKEIARADHERTRTYVCMRADDPMGAITTWAKAVGDIDAAGKALYGVVSHRLVRKLCAGCKAAYQPAPEMLKKLGLPADKVKQLFKKGGQVLVKNKPEACPACGGVGYLGQEGVFEVYKLGEAERAAIRKGDLNALKTELRKKSLPTLQQAALKKVVDGVTSVEELMRMAGGEESAKAPAPAGGTAKAGAVPGAVPGAPAAGKA